MPTEWIEKAQRYQYQQNNLALLKQLEGFVKPDSLAGERDSIHLDHSIESKPNGYFTPMFVNLDQDAALEMLGIFGYYGHDPMLAVFKKREDAWHLIYHESFFLHSEDPGLQIINSPSASKTFCLRSIQETGSGIRRDSYRFYKLINNRVRCCLELPNHTFIYGWGRYLNQEVGLTLRFTSTDEDAIVADYAYSFFPGAVYDKDVSWAAHPEIPFVKGENTAYYKWDAATSTYRLETFDSEGPAALTPAKIATFGSFENDSLFVRAFAYELGETLREGTPTAKRLLKTYLASVQHHQKPAVPSGELEEKHREGGTNFYGLKRPQ
ncbi:hypothetical protein GCM10027345_16480 [Hymenobacter daeguensis]